MDVIIPPTLPIYGSPLQFNRIGKITYPITLWLSSDGTNCKLSYIHGIGSFAMLTKEELKQVVDRCLQDCKGAVYINSVSKEVISKLRELYPVYSYTEVPIGYNNGFQYHILIKNTVVININCKDPYVPTATKATLPTSPIPHDYIRTMLTTLLKKKRRKTDIVDEFIKML